MSLSRRHFKELAILVAEMHVIMLDQGDKFDTHEQKYLLELVMQFCRSHNDRFNTYRFSEAVYSHRSKMLDGYEHIRELTEQ